MDLFDLFDVREINLRSCMIENFVKYVNMRRSVLHWLILYHDNNQKCKGNVNDGSSYYHVIIWFHTHSASGRKQYFSNLPVMQWLRRTYKRFNYFDFPNVLCFSNIGLRIDQLLSDGHIVIRHLSFPHSSVDDILERRK